MSSPPRSSDAAGAAGAAPADGAAPAAIPRFSFGDMALTDEPSRVPLPAPTSPTSPSSPSSLPADPSGPTSTVISDLRRAMLNELSAPEVLPFAADATAAARALVASQTEAVDEEEDEAEASLSTHLRRMEIDRVNYMLRSYFRARLGKIEEFAMFLMKDADSGMLDRLSADEERFLVGYSEMLKEHFQKSFFSMLPDRLRVVDKDGDVDPSGGPDLNKFVFCRVGRTVGLYSISEDESDDPFNLVKGDIVVARYGGIRPLLVAGDIELL